MMNRLLLMPLACVMLASPATAQSADQLAPALVACWQARGTPFEAGAVAARIGSRTGKAALLALAGATEAADGEEVETVVEITFEAGTPAKSNAGLMARDLARGLPLLLITTDGRVLLLTAMDAGRLEAEDAVTGERLALPASAAALIGRPLVSGA